LKNVPLVLCKSSTVLSFSKDPQSLPHPFSFEVPLVPCNSSTARFFSKDPQSLPRPFSFEVPLVLAAQPLWVTRHTYVEDVTAH
jgi:hypothetical protein